MKSLQTINYYITEWSIYENSKLIKISKEEGLKL